MLLYVEKRCVESRGILSPEWMRINPETHYQQFSAWTQARGVATPEQFVPSTIKAAPYPADNGHFAHRALIGHDEYDCLDDLAAAGYVRYRWPSRQADGTYIGPFGVVTDGTHPVTATRLNRYDVANYLMMHAVWSMTERGWATAHALRRWVAEGGDPHDFLPNE